MKKLLSNSPELWHITLPYSDYPQGFKELLRKEADWQKWVSIGPPCGYDEIALYSTIDGNDVCGLISDLVMEEDTFGFVYQPLSQPMPEDQQFYARGLRYKNAEGTECISQFFCFDTQPSDPLDNFAISGFPGSVCWSGELKQTPGPTIPQHNSQAYYAGLLEQKKGN